VTEIINLTSDRTCTYGCDAEGRLTSVTPGTVTVATYAYDAQGRRKQKTVRSAATLIVTGGDNHEVLEYDGTTGAVQRCHAFGKGVAGAMNLVGNRLTIILDIQGSVIATLRSEAGMPTAAGSPAFQENAGSVTGTFR